MKTTWHLFFKHEETYKQNRQKRIWIFIFGQQLGISADESLQNRFSKSRLHSRCYDRNPNLFPQVPFATLANGLRPPNDAAGAHQQGAGRLKAKTRPAQQQLN